MSLIYSDTSTLIPYYADEQFSSLSQKTFSSGEIYISSLTELEFYSFLNRMIRTGGITQKQKKQVLTLFNDHLRQGMFNMITVTDSVFKTARWCMERSQQSLRTLDSLHLGIVIQENLQLFTTDKIMYQAAKELGIDLLEIDL